MLVGDDADEWVEGDVVFACVSGGDQQHECFEVAAADGGRDSGGFVAGTDLFGFGVHGGFEGVAHEWVEDTVHCEQTAGEGFE